MYMQMSPHPIFTASYGGASTKEGPQVSGTARAEDVGGAGSIVAVAHWPPLSPAPKNQDKVDQAAIDNDEDLKALPQCRSSDHRPR